MKNTVEYYADSFTKFYLDNLESGKSPMQLYNAWVYRQPTTPSLEIAEYLLYLIHDLRNSKDKLKKEFVIALLK